LSSNELLTAPVAERLEKPNASFEAAAGTGAETLVPNRELLVELLVEVSCRAFATAVSALAEIVASAAGVDSSVAKVGAAPSTNNPSSTSRAQEECLNTGIIARVHCPHLYCNTDEPLEKFNPKHYLRLSWTSKTIYNLDGAE
jgi:hypothetical protein